MDCAAVDCTPDKVLEEMGLKRIAMCARKTRSQQSDERETTKRKLVEEILKEQDSRKKTKTNSTESPLVGKSTRDFIPVDVLNLSIFKQFKSPPQITKPSGLAPRNSSMVSLTYAIRSLSI